MYRVLSAWWRCRVAAAAADTSNMAPFVSSSLMSQVFLNHPNYARHRSICFPNCLSSAAYDAVFTRMKTGADVSPIASCRSWCGSCNTAIRLLSTHLVSVPIFGACKAGVVFVATDYDARPGVACLPAWGRMCGRRVISRHWRPHTTTTCMHAEWEMPSRLTTYY